MYKSLKYFDKPLTYLLSRFQRFIKLKLIENRRVKSILKKNTEANLGFKCNSKLRSLFKNLIYNYKDKKSLKILLQLKKTQQYCDNNFTIKYTMPV